MYSSVNVTHFFLLKKSTILVCRVSCIGTNKMLCLVIYVKAFFLAKEYPHAHSRHVFKADMALELETLAAEGVQITEGFGFRSPAVDKYF